MVRVVLLVALLALIAVRVFGHTGGGATDLSSAQLAHLPVQLNPHQPRPVHQSAALSCFNATAAVSSARSQGNDLTVRFAGAAKPMKIEFLADENAAIRATNADPKESGDYVNNTIWLQSPSDLSRSDSNALGKCIPS